MSVGSLGRGVYDKMFWIMCWNYLFMSSNENISNHRYINISIDILIQNIDESKID